MRIVFFGIEELGETCLKALLGAGYDVAGLVTLPAEPLSKPHPLRRIFGASSLYPIERIARSHRIPVMAPPRLKDSQFLRSFQKLKPDLIVVACFDKILPPELLEIPRLGGINVHPSLLPRHRGPAPVARTLLSGDQQTGISIHVLDAGVDTGDLLVQRHLAIKKDETAGSLSHRLAVLAPIALLETLTMLWEGRLKPQPQRGNGTHAPFLTRQEVHLDWRASVEDLARMVRACNPYPGAFTIAQDQATAVLEAMAIHDASPREVEPGTILSADPHGVVIQAGDGTLWCQKFRRAGRIGSPAHLSELFRSGEVLPSGDWSSL